MKSDRGCCDECGEGYDNEEEWKYNVECELCGHPIPKHLIIKK
jgi:PHP family Zn ribbon phosphoesterase